MGIDRADVRWVIHYQIPGTLEAYYQESGRAERDGSHARAILLYAPRDRELQEYFIENDSPSIEQLRSLHAWLGQRLNGVRSGIVPMRQAVQEATGVSSQVVPVGVDQLRIAGVLQAETDDLALDPIWRVEPLTEPIARSIQQSNTERRHHKRRQLERMLAYAEGGTSRRQFLLDYFGEESPGPNRRCCDWCMDGRKPAHPPRGPLHPARPLSAESAESGLNPVEVVDVVLECARVFCGQLHRTNLARILIGSESVRIASYAGHEHFGRLRGMRRRQVVSVIDSLIERGALNLLDGLVALPTETPSPSVAQPVARDPETTHQNRAAQRIVALGESGNTSHIPELITSLSDPDGNVRRLAASALGKLRSAEAVESLLRLLQKETGPQVRQYAIKALGRIGDARSVVMLTRIADDVAERDYNRIAARRSLTEIRAGVRRRHV